MILRTIVPGRFVAVTQWVMPDGTVTWSKVSQKQYDACVETQDWQSLAPSPDALFVAAAGGIPALNTADGYPSHGDCWEMSDLDEKGQAIQTVLHVQDGDDPMGSWSAGLPPEFVPVKGMPVAKSDEVLLAWSDHRVILTDYDQAHPELSDISAVPRGLAAVLRNAGLIDAD